MDLSLFASSFHGGGGWWLWKWWSVGSNGESWAEFVNCLILVSMGFGLLDLRCFGVLGVCWVLFSMGFGVWLLRKCKKRNKKLINPILYPWQRGCVLVRMHGGGGGVWFG